MYIGLRCDRLEDHPRVASMTRLKSLLATIAATVLLMLATPAFAQYRPWPTSLPPAPIWGDFDSGHTWHDAAWWWQSQPEWVSEHHPEWWGDVDGGVWYPAGWWWQQRRDWVLQNHPEWWGDTWDD